MGQIFHYEPTGAYHIWKMRASIRWYIWLEKRLTDGLFDQKRGCLGNSELKDMAFTAIRLRRRNTLEALLAVTTLVSDQL